MRFVVKNKDDTIHFINASQIYFVEAERDDILVRTCGKRLLRSYERITQVESRLKSIGNFFRAHRSFLVNLDRVRGLRPRGTTGYAL